MNANDSNRSSRPTEIDARFPSGPWQGFFLQPSFFEGQVRMEMALEFCGGLVRGMGTDPIGEYAIFGRYGADNEEVTFQKRYLGKHTVFYRGFAEGDGIWGVWQIPGMPRGGFHIRPDKLLETRKSIEVEVVPAVVRILPRLVTTDY